MAAYRKSMGPTTCVRCDAHLDPSTAFLSGDGPICDICHKEAAAKAKAVARARSTGTDVVLYGLLAVAGGVAMLALSLLLPDGPTVTGVLKIGTLGAAAGVGGCIQTFRLPAEKGPAKLGRTLGVVGAAAALFGFILVLFRLL